MIAFWNVLLIAAALTLQTGCAGLQVGMSAQAINGLDNLETEGSVLGVVRGEVQHGPLILFCEHLSDPTISGDGLNHCGGLYAF